MSDAAAPETEARTTPRLAVMLDWENFPGIRPASEPLPLPEILGFLDTHYDIVACICYAQRATISEVRRIRLSDDGFEVRLLDRLVDANGKKNSLDLCLAMDAVKLALEQPVDAFALLVAGDKDFAVVSAFIRHRLEREVLAFGSSYCPNPTLARSVDHYFMLGERRDWGRQLDEGDIELPSEFSADVLEAARRVRPIVVEALAQLGPETPVPLGTVGAVIHDRLEQRSNAQLTLRISTLLEALGCKLAADRQTLTRWNDVLVEAAHRAGRGRARAQPRWLPDRASVDAFARCVARGYAVLGDDVHYPLPLSVLHSAMCDAGTDFRQHLSKRLRLWQALDDLGFELNDVHTEILGAHGEPARTLLYDVHEPRQLTLFGDDALTGSPPRLTSRGYDRTFAALEDDEAQVLEAAEEALVRRLEVRQPSLWPVLEATLKGAGPRQPPLPFSDEPPL